jgi:EAL domain-containing protein (putative c-di-GMP-specific phosphodiesterase class I)
MVRQADGSGKARGVVKPLSDPLSEAMQARARDAVNMVRDALENRQVMLAYQPVVQTARPDRPAFYEGLVRVLDSAGRVIPARDFIDSVEQDELGRRLDCLALQLGLEALSSVPELRLAINMSARSIGYRPWQQVLERGLQRDKTAGERLILEITESSAITMPEVVQAFMSDLQSRGIAFALDDFGAGYTAFRHLRDLYFDILKIDGQFIRGIHANPDNQALTRALVSVARHFDMVTIAESVESAQDAAFLTDAGVDCMQGYHFGAPTLRPGWLDTGPQRAVAG